MRKICFVTGTRAEYGILSRLMRLVAEDPELQLQIIATNMHLMPEYGNTYKEIEADGFTIDRKVYMSKPSDDAHGVIASMAEEMLSMTKAYADLQPDLIVLLGDRYEIMVAAQVALINRIPIAHIHGGEVTEGAFDDAIRHSVTKMSSLHFTSCEEYRRRVIQMGENPEMVYNCGSLGVENIKSIPLMTKEELEDSLKFKIDEKTILVTYHPATLGGSPWKDIQNFLSALDAFNDIRVIFTMPNSDTGRDEIAAAIKDYVKTHSETTVAFDSLGLKRYLSTLKYVKAVVGNSSSGIIEVPSFGIPTVNIGPRQNGRLMADSVICCGIEQNEIVSAMTIALSEEFRDRVYNTRSPYEVPNTAEKILNVIKTSDLNSLQIKSFFDYPIKY